MSEPVAGNHNDLYDMAVQFDVVTATLEKADIPVEGLFPNADAGFDFREFRKSCGNKQINANVCFNKRKGNVERDEYFDQQLYDKRYMIERTNAWTGSYRSLLNRFDTTTESWKGLNYLAFFVIALKKFKTRKKFKTLLYKNLSLYELKTKIMKTKHYILLAIFSAIFSSCTQQETLAIEDQDQSVETLENTNKTEIFVFEGETFEMDISDDFTVDKDSANKMDTELARIFELPELVTYFDGSGRTMLFRNYDDYGAFENDNTSKKGASGKSSIVGYARLYDLDNYSGTQKYISNNGLNVCLVNSFNDKANSLKVNNARVAFYENSSSSCFGSGKVLVVRDPNLNPNQAVGYSRLRRVYMKGLKSWRNQISEAKFLTY